LHRVRARADGHVPERIDAALGELLPAPDEDRGHDLVARGRQVIERGLDDRWVVLAVDDDQISDVGPP
jgi:hypothetical protein